MSDSFDMSELEKAMSSSYASQPTSAEHHQMVVKRTAGGEAKKKIHFNRHTGCELCIERIDNPALYCMCNNCKVLPYLSTARENFCCLDKVSRSTKWLKNLKNVMEEEKLSCITEWDVFQSMCLKKRSIISHIKTSRLVSGRSSKIGEIDNKNCRYVAARIYTANMHGHNIGTGVRIELPNCVRNAICEAFPATNMNEYSNFEATAFEEETFLLDEFILSEDSQGSIYEGNIDFISATVTSGIPYERMKDFSETMSLGIPCRSAQQKVLHKYVHKVVEDIYLEQNSEIIKNMHASSGNIPLSLIGDAQYDSRGYSAGICRYVMMNYDSRLIIDYEVMTRQEAQGNSPRMEPLCFEKIMKRLQSLSLLITSFTSDKNSSIVKLMREKWPTVAHTLDKWHVHKNFNKYNDKEFKLKRNADLAAHREHLLIHIWTSISAAKGNGELACELIRSAEFHLQNIHTLPKEEFHLLDRCPHPIVYQTSKSYLDPNVAKQLLQIKTLHNMINDSNFLSNVRKCAPYQTTSPIESFHGVVGQIYIQKNIYYDKRTTETLMRMAILHYNQLKMAHKSMVDNGQEPHKSKKFSRAQNRMVDIITWPKFPLPFKRTVLEKVKKAYITIKEERQQNRKVGRPPRTEHRDYISEDSDLEDFIIYSDDEEPFELHTPYSDYEDDDEDDAQQPTNSTPVAQPFTPKTPFYVNKKQFLATLQAMGPLADEYQFIDEDTQQILLPITVSDPFI